VHSYDAAEGNTGLHNAQFVVRWGFLIDIMRYCIIIVFYFQTLKSASQIVYRLLCTLVWAVTVLLQKFDLYGQN
jgi:hypothetical protein